MPGARPLLIGLRIYCRISIFADGSLRRCNREADEKPYSFTFCGCFCFAAKIEEMKQDLLSKISVLGKELPLNTLDELIDKFGGPELVSEVSALWFWGL